MEFLRGEIQGYYNLIENTPCPQFKISCSSILLNKMFDFTKLYLNCNDSSEENFRMEMPLKKEFTLAEISIFDGTEGKDAYIVVNGKVYDVSLTPSWAGGTHMGIRAGRDVTKDFQNCHAGSQEILNKLTPIGVLRD